MTFTIINDVHLGVQRTGGTTPETQYLLRQAGFDELARLLDLSEGTVIFNGDLCDSYKLVPADILKAVSVLRSFADKGGKLIGLPGNHCLSKNSNDLSAFELIFRLLVQLTPNATLQMEPGQVAEGIYAIPHVANQDIFNLELEKVPEGTEVLLVHANYDNGFAVESDHSLNVSEEQARTCPAKRIIFGHEHQAAEHLEGKVVITGNQFPTSVADCLGNSTKRMVIIRDDFSLDFKQTWQAEGDFTEQPWDALEDVGRFIRVVGTVPSEAMGDAITAIAKFRRTASALVITNALRTVDANKSVVSFEEITQKMRAFDIWQQLAELFTPEEIVRLKSLEEDHAEDH